MVAHAEQLERQLIDDPVAAREALVARYSKFPPEKFPEFKAPQYDHGARGSIQRARKDQADAEDLAAAEARYGKGLPQILKQLEAFDRALIENPHHASAKLAVTYGAPALESQIPAYKAAQAAKQQARAHQERYDNIHRGVQLAIHHKLIPGDEATLTEMAAVMSNPKFQHSRTNPIDTMQRAAAIVAHPSHEWTTGKKAQRRRDAGSRSIGGGSPSSAHQSPRDPRGPGTGGVRDSISRVAGR
jgi:hypothetical protein